MIDTPNIPSSSSIPPSPDGKAVTSRQTLQLTHFPQGSLQHAVVVRHDGQGNAVINLQSGSQGTRVELAITSKIALPVGSNLTLKIASNDALPPSAQYKAPEGAAPSFQFQAHIISINGKSPVLPPNVSPDSPEAQLFNLVRAVPDQKIVTIPSPLNPSAGAAGVKPGVVQSATIVNVSTGTLIDAVVLNPAYGAERFLPEVPATQAKPAGGGLTPNNIPAEPGGSVNTSVSSAQANNTGSAGIPTSNSSPTLSTPALKTGDIVTLHIISTHVPDTPKQGNPAPGVPLERAQYAYTRHIEEQAFSNKVPGRTAANIGNTAGHNPVPPVTTNPQFAGTVIGTERSGELVVKTPIGTIKLPAGITFPQGTRLVLESVIVHSAPADTESLTAGETERNGSVLRQQIVKDGPPFEELASVLRTIDAEIGSSTLQKVLPHADKQAAAKLLWFIASVSKNNLGMWLSPEVRSMLEQYNKQDLLTKLESSFTTMKTHFTETNTQGWQTLLFPFFDGKEIQYGQFYMRRYKPETGENGTSQDLRFLVEVDLDYMGEIQLDGLVKHVLQHKQFDLYVRTRLPLSEEMRQDIVDIFAESAELSGVTGHVQFQVTDHFLTNHFTSPHHAGDGNGIVV